MSDMSEMTNVKLDMQEHDRPVTIVQAAAHFGVTTRTIDRWEQIAGLPVHRVGGGPKARKFYFLAELNLWARSRCSAPTPASGAGRRPDGLIG